MLLVLDCYKKHCPEHALGISVYELYPGGDQYARFPDKVVVKSSDLINMYEPKTIYIRKEIVRPERDYVPEMGKSLAFRISMPQPGANFKVVGALPPECWDGRNMVLSPPKFANHRTSYNNWSWRAFLYFDGYHQDNWFPFALIIGYDGRIDRCWVGCNYEWYTDRKSEDVEQMRKMMVSAHEMMISTHEWDTSCSELEHIACQREYDIVIALSLLDSKGHQIKNWKSGSREWDGKPIQAKLTFEKQVCNCPKFL
jgi:hypothetical protein